MRLRSMPYTYPIATVTVSIQHIINEGDYVANWDCKTYAELATVASIIRPAHSERRNRKSKEKEQIESNATQAAKTQRNSKTTEHWSKNVKQTAETKSTAKITKQSKDSKTAKGKTKRKTYLDPFPHSSARANTSSPSPFAAAGTDRCWLTSEDDCLRWHRYRRRRPMILTPPFSRLGLLRRTAAISFRIF